MDAYRVTSDCALALPWPLTPGSARLGPFILALTGRHGGDLGLDLCKALAMVVHGARCLKGPRVRSEK